MCVRAHRLASVPDVFPVGGVGVMLLGAAGSGLLCALLTLLLRHRLGGPLATLAGLLTWSVVVIGLVTLIPANGAPGVVSAETRLPGCSWDVGGPAPDGFWIFSSGQRALNTALFVPSGVLVALLGGALAERARESGRRGWRVVGWTAAPVGLLVLAAYSAGIELTQLELARLDRACDVTDVVDNVTGAFLGVVAGAAVVVAVAAQRGTARALRRRRDRA